MKYVGDAQMAGQGDELSRLVGQERDPLFCLHQGLPLEQTRRVPAPVRSGAG